MAVWEEVRHQVAISGKVIGPVKGMGLGHVRVSIIDGPDEYLEWLAVKQAIAGESWFTTAKRPDRVMTKPDGHFHFMDLPDGNYMLFASFPNKSTRFGGVQFTVTVSRTPEGAIEMAQADIVLPATTIAGTVVRQGDNTPVVMAKIKVLGSGEYAFTDENGAFVLAGIEASVTQSRVVTVSAAGYQDRTQPVAVDATGITVNCDVILSPL